MGLVLRCKDHPTYTGKNKPRVSKVTGKICPSCQLLHDTRKAGLGFKREAEYVDY